MSLIHDPPRQVVPRWRLFSAALQRGELLPATTVDRPPFTEESVAEQLHDWKQTPTLSVAADLVSAAFALGLDHIATEPALYVFDHPSAPPVARSIAALHLARAGIDMPLDAAQTTVLPLDVVVPTVRCDAFDRAHILEIHRLRTRLRDYTRNPIDWCNLALHYSCLGLNDKAARAIAAALSLAPDNRFVLRASSRFYLHVGERGRAHDVLSRSGAVRSDPWVLAADIAIADALRRSSTRAARGKRLLERGKWPDWHLSELASAVGTLELNSPLNYSLDTYDILPA